MIIIIFTYQKYFKNDEIIKDKPSEKIKEDSLVSTNLIKDLEYSVKFKNNTEYFITSELSEITYDINVGSQKENEVILMQKVFAFFRYQDGSLVEISSNKATYNNSIYNTTFENKVRIVYMDHIIKSEKLFIDFEKNIVMIKDNIVYEGLQGIAQTDNIKIDLISKNIEIFMNDNQDKIEINTEKE